MNSHDSIFLSAREISDPAKRAAYLDQACGGDTFVRARVEAMLRDAEGAEEFFGKEGTVVVAPIPLTEQAGTIIGRYKLLQKIGEGGMGVVYMAEQREPVVRKVALKIIKLGMDTKQVVARFEAERQALALMDHPNIAKVLDAGATETGRPYFVMELVQGLPITQFCDEANLPMGNRMNLFLDVCAAVQHAHQKGIIHRDLKPSNILVTLHGDKPVPMVIDFGVAKATQGRLTDKTVFTQFQQFIGTPAYMSPEQASLSGLDVDTRSDIYALGVLLYELLTGKTPFDAKELLEAGLDQMRQIIREHEPPKPSTRLSTMRGEDLTATARRRHTDPPKLVHLVRGDLDWIVMKCLEKDRARRYETTNGLAMDVQRYLGNEPIIARPPSQLYRFSKLVRRNKLAFAAAGAITFTLITGLAISTWSLTKERKARERAVAAEQTAEKALASEAQLRQRADDARIQAEENGAKAREEAAKSKVVARFLEDMLKGVNPSVALGRDTTVLREILDQTAKRVGEDLKDQPAVQAHLYRTLAETFENLGYREKAEAMSRESLRLRRTLYPGDHRDVAEALVDEASALGRLLRLEEAENLALEGEAMTRRLFGPKHWKLAKAMAALSGILLRQGKASEAEAILREVVAMQRELGAESKHSLLLDLALLSSCLQAQGKFEEAVALRKEVLATRRAEHDGEDHPQVAGALTGLGVTQMYSGDLKGAEASLLEAMELARKFIPEEDPARDGPWRYLVELYRKQGRDAEADAVKQEWQKARSKREPQKAAETELPAKQTPVAAKPAAENEPVSYPGDALARQSQFAEAIAPFSQRVNLHPDDLLSFIKLTALLLETRNFASYSNVCHEALQRFASTQDRTIARRLSKSCLLAPLPGGDIKLAAKLARFAGEGPLEEKSARQARFGTGLADFREGRFDAALVCLNSMTNLPASPEPIRVQFRAANDAVAAMCQYHLGQTNTARTTLAHATEASKLEWSKIGIDDLGANWQDTLIAHILLREAQTLLDSAVRDTDSAPAR